MYKYMKTVMKGDDKAEISQQDDSITSCAVINFTTVMVTMTIHIFPS